MLVFVVGLVIIFSVRHYWYQIYPYRGVGDMEPVIPSPGYPQLQIYDRIWEIVGVRRYSDNRQFDLLLRYGKEDERIEHFNTPEQIAPRDDILSVLAPRGAAVFTVLDGNIMNTPEGMEKYEQNFVRALQRIRELERENRSLEHDLLILENKFDDKLDKEMKRILDQTKAATPATMMKDTLK